MTEAAISARNAKTPMAQAPARAPAVSVTGAMSDVDSSMTRSEASPGPLHVVG